MTTMRRWITLMLTSALIGACNQEHRRVPPAPSDRASSGLAAEEKVSIIRPDVGIEEDPAPPMVPLSLRIGFDEGGTALGKAALEALSDALASEQMKAGGAITLAGHSDSTGDDADNLLVSRKRAEAVREWLTAHGVAADRITVVAIGEQNPVAPNATSQGEPNRSGRAKNRRVELRVGVPLGTPPAAEPSRQETLVDAIASE